ncbi:hypothetical protein P879_05946 [Paragonimus westermani]|uniref:Exonuclease domain-containing protein n=1 Tax=Paragonimus westermani TaxID=34504 RepID=A0A8T0DLN6_9TREM|nr:hypothetical protein P879_05946 [Paragonimus westermani]
MQKTLQHAASCGAIFNVFRRGVQPSHLINSECRTFVLLRHDSYLGVRWYFVLDFESTCSEDKTHVPEIIEFPVVILDSVDGTIVDHFQRFVRPTENPLLTSFCKNLTGVKQSDVDSAGDLSVVLKEFEIWLKLKKEELGCRFKSSADASAIFVTWTDWDISTCLWNECRRKKLALPHDLLNRMDMKAMFQQWLGSCSAREKWRGGLSDALTLVGLTFEGRPHRGIDDARNTSRLLFHLLSKSISLVT